MELYRILGTDAGQMPFRTTPDTTCNFSFARTGTTSGFNVQSSNAKKAINEGSAGIHVGDLLIGNTNVALKENAVIFLKPMLVDSKVEVVVAY